MTFSDHQNPENYAYYVYLVLIAVLGLASALFMTEAKDIAVLVSEINLIIAIDAILIPFIPLLFEYLQKSFTYFKGKVEKIAIRLEIFLAVSLILSILAITFSNVFTSSFPFPLSTNFNYTILQWVYILNLTAAFSFLIAAMFSIILISERAINYVDLSFLDGIKDFILEKFHYMPIYPTENIQKPDETFLKLPLNFYDEKGLKTTIDIMLRPDSNILEKYNTKVDSIIDRFLKEFPSLAENILKQRLKVYTIMEAKLQKEEQKQILITGLFNSILGYNEYYYPNIYTRIKGDKKLEDKYSQLMEELPNNKEVKEFLRLAKEITSLKTFIETEFINLIEKQI